MLKSSLCDYSDAYILVSATITTGGAEEMMQQNDQMKDIKELSLKTMHHLLIVYAK